MLIYICIIYLLFYPNQYEIRLGVGVETPYTPRTYATVTALIPNYFLIRIWYNEYYLVVYFVIEFH